MENEKLKPGPALRSGDPVETTILENGGRRHVLVDGRVIEEFGAMYELEYESYEPGETYEVDISILRLTDSKYAFEAWCYQYNGLRAYAFHKTVRITNLKTRKAHSGEELRQFLDGATFPTRGHA